MKTLQTRRGDTKGRPCFEEIAKYNKGITLIALIITIIVMLILVGVSVNVAINGGIFTKAKEAATQAVKKSSVIAQGRSKRITPEVQQYVRDELTSTDKSGNTFLLNYIKAFLTEAKKDPNSNCGRMLASAIFNDKLFSTLDEEANKATEDVQKAQEEKTAYEQQIAEKYPQIQELQNTYNECKSNKKE